MILGGGSLPTGSAEGLGAEDVAEAAAVAAADSFQQLGRPHGPELTLGVSSVVPCGGRGVIAPHGDDNPGSTPAPH